jgi:hypothetical protein
VHPVGDLVVDFRSAARDDLDFGAAFDCRPVAGIGRPALRFRIERTPERNVVVLDAVERRDEMLPVGEEDFDGLIRTEVGPVAGIDFPETEGAQLIGQNGRGGESRSAAISAASLENNLSRSIKGLLWGCGGQ